MAQQGLAGGAPDDPLDSLLSLESQYFEEGYALGLADGARAGRMEGRLFGLEKGVEKGRAMGRLHGRALVWQARLPRASPGAAAAPLVGSARLGRRVARLVELSDPASLETKNTEDAVIEFDERLAGARAKAMLVAKMVAEDAAGAAAPTGASGRCEGAGTGGDNDGNEIEITRPQSGRGEGRKPTVASGEMEDFAGLPRAAAARKTT